MSPKFLQSVYGSFVERTYLMFGTQNDYGLLKTILKVNPLLCGYFSFIRLKVRSSVQWPSLKPKKQQPNFYDRQPIWYGKFHKLRVLIHRSVKNSSERRILLLYAI